MNRNFNMHFFVGLLMLVGCNRGPSDSQVIELLTSSQRDQPVTFTIESPKVISCKQAVGRDSYDCEIEMNGVLRVALLEESDITRAWKALNYDPQPFF